MFLITNIIIGEVKSHPQGLSFLKEMFTYVKNTFSPWVPAHEEGQLPPALRCIVISLLVTQVWLCTARNSQMGKWDLRQ